MSGRGAFALSETRNVPSSEEPRSHQKCFLVGKKHFSSEVFSHGLAVPAQGGGLSRGAPALQSMQGHTKPLVDLDKQSPSQTTPLTSRASDSTPGASQAPGHMQTDDAPHLASRLISGRIQRGTTNHPGDRAWNVSDIERGFLEGSFVLVLDISYARLWNDEGLPGSAVSSSF